MIKFVAAASVSSTSQVVMIERQIYINKPVLTLMRVPEEMVTGTSYMISVEFSNPLDMALTSCELIMDGSAISQRIIMSDLA